MPTDPEDAKKWVDELYQTWQPRRGQHKEECRVARPQPIARLDSIPFEKMGSCCMYSHLTEIPYPDSSKTVRCAAQRMTRRIEIALLFAAGCDVSSHPGRVVPNLYGASTVTAVGLFDQLPTLFYCGFKPVQIGCKRDDEDGRGRQTREISSNFLTLCTIETHELQEWYEEHRFLGMFEWDWALDYRTLFEFKKTARYLEWVKRNKNMNERLRRERKAVDFIRMGIPLKSETGEVL